MKTIIVYGSQKGNTERVAHRIREKINVDIDIANIKKFDIKLLQQYDNIIIGTPSYGNGELPNSWKKQLEAFRTINLKNKKVAFFGLGDQKWHKDTFINSIKILFDISVENNATIIGDNVSIENYSYEETLSTISDKFVGLAIDESNESHLTEERINNWVKTLQIGMFN